MGKPSRRAAKAAVAAHVAVQKGTPLRQALSDALAAEPGLGGKERRFAAFAARELSRHLRLLDLHARARGRAPGELQLDEDRALLRYALWRVVLRGAAADVALAEVALPGPVRPRSIPDAVLREVLASAAAPELAAPDPLEQAAVQHSFPTWLARAIARAAPPGEAPQVLAALNHERPLAFLVRPPAEREAVLAELRAAGVSAAPLDGLPRALILSDDSRAIFESRPMKARQLMVMDPGSQALVELCRPAAGQVVADLCAGACGKAIALADRVGPQGRVLAFDASARRLAEGRARVRELKVRNVSFPAERRLEAVDLALIDAPCSGSGTLGREPDQKWRLTQKKVDALRRTQAELLDAAARGLRAGAALVYATCSLLLEEDEEQVRAALGRHPALALEAEVRLWPHQGPWSGFYGARLTKRA